MQVLGFSSRKEADDFIQRREKYVLGAVHFVTSPTKQLQYIIQSNTSVSLRSFLHALQSNMRCSTQCPGTTHRVASDKPMVQQLQ